MNARTIIPTGRRLRILRRPPESILPSSPRPARRDCHGRLIAALLDLGGVGASVEDSSLTAWCSATFIGARHGFVLDFQGKTAADTAARLAKMLPEREFRIPGHIVADLCVDALTSEGPDAARLTLSVLTIESW